MVNNIEEDYCSFEVSKLLKATGFKCDTITQYITANTRSRKKGEMFTPCFELDQTACENHGIPSSKMINAPTHAVAIKWIRMNFGIHIEVFKQRGVNGLGYNFMCIPVKTGENNSTEVVNEDGYETPEMATEAALIHTLINITK